MLPWGPRRLGLESDMSRHETSRWDRARILPVALLLLCGLTLLVPIGCGSAAAPSGTASISEEPASSSPSPAAPDPYVGDWRGYDSLGQGPYSMTIRKNEAGEYESIKSDGSRVPLYSRGESLTGKDYIDLSGSRSLKASLRFVPTASGGLRSTMKVKPGGGLGTVTVRMKWERK